MLEYLSFTLFDALQFISLVLNEVRKKMTEEGAENFLFPKELFNTLALAFLKGQRNAYMTAQQIYVSSVTEIVCV